MKLGKYVYGIINSPEQVYPALASKNGVYTIPYQDIAALVSDSKVIDYTCIPKDTVARYLLRHQKIIEGIMPEHSIIPMRVGTYASDEAEVQDVLNKGYKIIKDVFAKISDKIEIDLACTWSNFNSVLKEVGEEKEIKEFKEQLLANPKAVTVDDQMKVGVVVKKVLDEKREKHAFQIQSALRNLSQDFKKHELMDEQMVANFAFLIEKAKRADFDKKVEELNTEFHDKLNFRCVGPLPPYSFYTLEIKKMDFKQVDWARKRLGLNAFASKDEIKKAHKRSSLASHPDKHPDTPGMERVFDEAIRAYKIIEDFCRACEQTAQQESLSFNENVFKNNAILVRVRQ